MGVLFDKILGKLRSDSLGTTNEARLQVLENNEYKITYFAEISSSTGTITPPTGGTILLNQFEGGVDAYVNTISSGKPTGDFPQTSGGTLVDVASFDALGNYTLTDTPNSFPVALIFEFKIKAINLSNVDKNYEIGYEPIEVRSVFSRKGDIVAALGDYTASQITNTPTGSIAATNVQDAIDELDTEKVSTADSRLTDSRHEILVAYQNTDSSHTGSLTQTILCNLLIPANTMGPNDIFWFESMPFSVGGTSMTWKAYLSPTSGNFAAGTLIAELTGTFLYPTFCRRIANKNSQTTNNVLGLTATGAMLENGGAAQPRSAVNINWTVDQYLIVTGTLSNSAHTIGLDNIQCYVKKVS